MVTPTVVVEEGDEDPQPERGVVPSHLAGALTVRNVDLCEVRESTPAVYGRGGSLEKGPNHQKEHHCRSPSPPIAKESKGKKRISSQERDDKDFQAARSKRSKVVHDTVFPVGGRGGFAIFPSSASGDAVQAKRSKRSKAFHDVALPDEGVSVPSNSSGPPPAAHVSSGNLAPPSVPAVGEKSGFRLPGIFIGYPPRSKEEFASTLDPETSHSLMVLGMLRGGLFWRTAPWLLTNCLVCASCWLGCL